MKCLKCGQEIENPSDSEKQTQWHEKCTRDFFFSDQFPVIDISSENLLDKLGIRSLNAGNSITGVQKKISLHLHSGHNGSRLTVTRYPTGYILKPSSVKFPYLPEFEWLGMQLARTAGLQTAPFGLIRLPDQWLAYITRRVDRNIPENSMYGMEDFCQLSNRITEYKYKGSYERCLKIIGRYSKNIYLDLAEFFARIVFCFITGNSDMHLKNFSLIETRPGNREYTLSPLYDQLPVNIVMPNDPDQTALTLNGKNRHLHRGDFLKFADSIKLPRKTATNLIDRFTGFEQDFLKVCDESFLPETEREKVKQLIHQRIQDLQ